MFAAVLGVKGVGGFGGGGRGGGEGEGEGGGEGAQRYGGLGGTKEDPFLHAHEVRLWRQTDQHSTDVAPAQENTPLHPPVTHSVLLPAHPKLSPSTHAVLEICLTRPHSGAALAVARSMTRLRAGSVEAPIPERPTRRNRL